MITLNVTGMDCQGCVRAVEKAVKRVDPNAQVIVDLPTGLVSIDTMKDPGGRADFETAITRAGYGVSMAA
jgi:copper chaperone